MTEHCEVRLTNILKDFKSNNEDKIEPCEPIIDISKFLQLDVEEIKSEPADDEDPCFTVDGSTNGARISSVVNDYAVLTCKICGYEHFLDQFIKHLKKDHSMSTVEYKNQYEFSFKDKVLHQCAICDKLMLYSCSNLKNHLYRCHKRDKITILAYKERYLLGNFSSDSMTVEPKRKEKPQKLKIPQPEIPGRYSDKWRDFASFQCHMCDYFGEYRSLLRHIKSSHKLTSSEYKHKFGTFLFADKVLHKCRLCGFSIVFRVDTVTHHLRLKHPRVTNEFYREMLAWSEEECKKYSKELSLDQDEEDDPSNSLKKRFKPDNTKEENNMDDLTVRFSDLPNDFSVYQCAKCDYRSIERDLYEHSKFKHSLSFKKLKLKFGPAKCVEKVYHICKICDQKIFYNSYFMNRHLEVHDLTYTLYREQYLDKGEDKYLETFAMEESTLEDATAQQNGSNHADESSPVAPISGCSALISWYDGRSFSCLKCQFNTKIENDIQSHVKSTHVEQSEELTDDMYTTHVPLFTCTFCEAKVPHEKVSMEAHLEEHHYVSLEEFSQVYMKMPSTLAKLKKSLEENAATPGS